MYYVIEVNDCYGCFGTGYKHEGLTLIEEEICPVCGGKGILEEKRGLLDALFDLGFYPDDD